MGLLDDKWFRPPKENIHFTEAKANRLLKRKKIRRGKKHKIPKMTYREYITSAYWKKRKMMYFSKFGKTCAVCGQKSGVTLHHKKYDDKLFGKEPNDHLVALCPRHHQSFHENFGVQSNMTKNTNLFVKHERQVVEFDRESEWLKNI